MLLFRFDRIFRRPRASASTAAFQPRLAIGGAMKALETPNAHILWPAIYIYMATTFPFVWYFYFLLSTFLAVFLHANIVKCSVHAAHADMHYVHACAWE